MLRESVMIWPPVSREAMTAPPSARARRVLWSPLRQCREEPFESFTDFARRFFRKEKTGVERVARHMSVGDFPP